MRNPGKPILALLQPPDLGAAWQAAMRAGEFAAAWRISDAVMRLRDPARRDDPALPYHQRWVWDGRNFDGRDALVRCYHGLGDTLQFARYLPALRRRARSVMLETQPKLVSLLAPLRDPGTIIPFDPSRPAPPRDCDLEIMELAHALRMAPNQAPAPYLRASPLPLPRGEKPLVGLCWAVGEWAPERSLPFDLLADAVLGTPAAVVKLQHGPEGARAEASHPGLFVNAGDPLRGLLYTARLIAALDLVITADTMTAHLAGALGRPAWVILPHSADWRWMDERNDSPWYPTVRLFRQRKPGDWRAPLDEIAARLAGRPRKR
jgi:ADP-heptose:LPS heptosyltransferase